MPTTNDILAIAAFDKWSATGVLAMFCIMLLYIVKDKRRYLDQTDEILKQGTEILSSVSRLLEVMQKQQEIWGVHIQHVHEKINNIERNIDDIEEYIKYQVVLKGKYENDYKQV